MLLCRRQLRQTQALGKIKRNMPDPIPVMVLGRLAVDLNYQSQGIGMGLVKDAVMRTWQASEIVGVRAILVHALKEQVKKFYEEKCGFISSPSHPLTLMVMLADVKNNLNL
jgi:predicted N-acetyltransferase YhbS